MKWLLILGLLAVYSVQALPNMDSAAALGEEKDAVSNTRVEKSVQVNGRPKRMAGQSPEGEESSLEDEEDTAVKNRSKRMAGDEPGDKPNRGLSIDVDVNVNIPQNQFPIADIDVDVDINAVPTTLPTTGSCSVLEGDLPSGCKEYVYTVPSGFPGNESGRRNPERGFHMPTESKASSWDPVANQPLASWVNEGYTLIYRLYVLDTSVNVNITDDILQKIREDFAAIRDAGLKVLLRFSYSNDINVKDDAKPVQLKKHIEQLAPILQQAVGPHMEALLANMNASQLKKNPHAAGSSTAV